MRGASFLNVLLIGLVVLLAALWIDANRSDQWATAADTDRPGPPSGAGGVIAVTGRMFSDADVLYVVDTNNETLLVYAFARPGSTSGDTFSRGYLQLLAGRSYKFDSLAAEKVVIGKSKPPLPKETRREYLKNKDED